MAKTLKLNWGTVDLDLVTDSALSVMSWTPQVAMPRMNGEPGPVIESLTVKVSGSTHDALSTNLQSLHQMQAWAKSYIEDHAGTIPVWLHAKLTNETGERRALVRAIDAQFVSPWYGPMADNNPATMLALAIERDPYWEGTATVTGGAGSPTPAPSVVFDYTANGGADIVGDVPARIGEINIGGTPSIGIGRLWVGLRSTAKHGDLSQFTPVWECEDSGGELGTDAARATDTTASPGGTANTKVTITPGTSTWAERLTIALEDINNANPTEQFGEFLWLLRHKVTAGTWEAQLRYGFDLMGSADLVQGPIVQLTNAAWDFAEMGVAPIPFQVPYSPGGTARGDEGKSSVFVYARRTSGTGNLDLDCLCPIPVDEGYFRSGKFNDGYLNPSWLYRFESPRGDKSVFSGNAGYAPRESPAYTEDNFRLPPGDGRLVIAYAGPGTSLLDDAIQVANLQYYPRWASLRGGE